MPAPFDAPDNPAPVFGRRRDWTPAPTYWKCQIGRRIHLAREDAARRAPSQSHHFGRDAFAARIGISSRHLWEIENGILTIDVTEVAIIAQALGMHPGCLFDELSFDCWVTPPNSSSPTWILARTIGQLPNADRELLEQLVIRLDARSAALAA
jgi:transcriptional regulator with XRE-family HTH domain